MNNKINVQIFGEWDSVLGGDGGCSKGGCSSGGCGGCSGGSCGHGSTSGDCSSKALKTAGESYKELVEFIENSDIKEFANLEFLDIKKINILDYDDIRYLYDEGYELPYCAIDGVVRFYGGISSRLIYKDIKELV